MKKTFYLFNPGMMERKDNTLKFTPFAIDEDGTEHPGQPRYLPVEDISEFYCFGSLKANSSLFNFLGQKDICMHFFDYYENYTGSFMSRDSLLSGRMLLAQRLHIRIKGSVWRLLRSLLMEQFTTWYAISCTITVEGRTWQTSFR